MALRNIVVKGDEVLRKKCKEIKNIDDKIISLLDDMAQTMYDADGVGLAGPQVGVLKRLAVIDVGEGIIEIINPIITKKSGEQTDIEGCLSLPDVYGKVKRPMQVEVEALNRNGEKIIIKGEGLLARALCHEIDHLDGILFEDKVIEFIELESE